VFLKTNVLTLVKLGQMTYLMTSNEKILNTKLLELMKIQTFYINHLLFLLSGANSHLEKLEHDQLIRKIYFATKQKGMKVLLPWHHGWKN